MTLSMNPLNLVNLLNPLNRLQVREGLPIALSIASIPAMRWSRTHGRGSSATR